MINYDIESELKPHLTQDEKLLWAGVPKQGVVFRGNDMFMIPISIIWFGTFLFIWSQSIKAEAPFPFGLFFIPFFLAGGYMIIGRFFLDSWRRSKIKYGITNERVIIISGFFSMEVSSVSAKNNTVSYKEKNRRQRYYFVREL